MQHSTTTSKKKGIANQKSLKNLKFHEKGCLTENKPSRESNIKDIAIKNANILFDSANKMSNAKPAESENNSNAVTRAQTNISDTIAAKAQSEEAKISSGSQQNKNELSKAQINHMQAHSNYEVKVNQNRIYISNKFDLA